MSGSSRDVIERQLRELAWWGAKSRRAFRHLFGRVSSAERTALAERLSAPQLALFDAMHPADQRHGLDVMRQLELEGHRDPDLLLAALFHDAGKGPGVGLVHRVAWSLEERYGERVQTVTARVARLAPGLRRMRVHAELSAELALAAGCSPATAALIRQQAHPEDDSLARALLVADQAN